MSGEPSSKPAVPMPGQIAPNESDPLLNKQPSKKVDIVLPPPIFLVNIQDEHLLSFDQVLEKHKTDFNPPKPTDSRGLNSEEAIRRLSSNGPNILTPPKKKSSLALYFECFSNLLNLIMAFCAVITWCLLALDPKETNNVCSFFSLDIEGLYG